MPGLYVTPKKYVEFGEMATRKSLAGEIATRATAWDYSMFVGLLPDPDPVLQRRGDGAEILDSLTADGHLMSVIQTRKLGSLKREYRWEAGTDGADKATPDAERLCDMLVNDMRLFGGAVYDLISQILDAPYFGLTPIEILWQPGPDGMRIAGLRGLPHRWFGFSDVNEPKFISRDNPWDGDALPPGKFVFARHFPTYDNPYGLRLLSRCFWPVMFKKGGIRFWIKFIEKYATPFLLGRYRPGATPEEQAELLAKLASMVQDAVAAVPDGSQVELLGAGDKAGSSDMYLRFVAAMDAEISKVIMGQTLTAEIGDKGSYAASQTHENVLDVYREADQRLVKATMDEIGAAYAAVNAPGVPAPVFVWFEVEEPQKEFAERDKILTESGVKFTSVYYQRRYGFKDDEFMVAEAARDSEEQSPGKRDGKGGEFAEPGGFTEEQQAVENLADLAISMGVEGLSGNEELLLRIVQESGSYEEAMERLLAAWPELEIDQLAAPLEAALLNAELFGRYTAK